MENPTEKVQLSPQQSVVVLSDDDCVLDISCGSDVEFLEPGKNTPLHDAVTSSQSYDSGVELVSQSSVEVLSQDAVEETIEITDNDKSQDTDQEVVLLDDVDSTTAAQDLVDAITFVDVKDDSTKHSDQDNSPRLLQLEEEVEQLKAENESLKLKTCLCRRAKDTVITISFDTLNSFNTYKGKICKLFNEYLNLELDEQESNLLIHVYNDSTVNPDEWVVVDEFEATPFDKRKKRRKRKMSSEEGDNLNDVFVLDTTPSLTTKNNLRYESKFDIATVANKPDEEIPKGTPNMCFNCDGTHNLRDCPHPRDHFKINAARQKFKPQNKATVYKRYHLDSDQRFEDFKPGKISSKLQQALGLRHNQLPEHIYRMRKLGYPPGWFNEFIASKESNLVLFDFNGKDLSMQRKMVEDVELNNIIDYHGFNIPLQKGFKDEHRLYDSPPYSKDLSKSKMMTFLTKYNNDNLNSCDMDIDGEVISVLKENQPDSTPTTTSPTLVELEIEKKKLLEQLTEDVNSNSFVESKNETSMTNDGSVTIDETVTIEQNNTLQSEVNETTIEDGKQCESPIVKNIKTSYMGTPILQSTSPYSRLPHTDNFTKNVSDVINFENLPNSTGKYDQMVGVLEKVRRTLHKKS